ncbi:MAG: metallopeptidase family protein [Actinobacteria bacterium]|nr:metallopeptidase family protein [Actinomycetota bacterium]
MEISIEEFEAEILDILEDLPQRFKDKFENIGFLIEEESISPFLQNKSGGPRYTLGLYHGVPFTSKRSGGQLLPDKIIIYKKSIEAVSRDTASLKKNIKRVVLHEVGHYFGLSEDKLKELGY